MTYPHRRALLGVAATVLTLAGCADQATAPVDVPERPSFSQAGTEEEPVGYSAKLGDVNRRMIAGGTGAVIERAELLLSPNAPAKTPRVIFAEDRELRLPTRWVSGDLRRLATTGELTRVVYSPLARASVGGPAEASFDASAATWNAVPCSKLAVRKIALARFPSAVLNPGVFPPADINDIGFLPPAYFEEYLGTGASQVVIGVTFTGFFYETDSNGNPILDPQGNIIPTDLDRDGRFDTAFKEVWFNDGLPYSTNGTPGTIDIESSALHEHGHALELGHFGKIAGDPKTGKLHVSPRAVMNAAILGTLRSPLGTDNAALCGNYASWQ